MALTSAERYRRFKAKLKLEKNKDLLQKFRENDAENYRKCRQLMKQDSVRMAKVREQNRAQQAKRRQKLKSENSVHNSIISAH